MATSIQQAISAATAAKEPTEVKYDGQVYRVLPPMQWRQSAMDAVTGGRINEWARRVMVNDAATDDKDKSVGNDDGTQFVEADLTNEQVIGFFAAYADAAGQTPGE